MLGLLTGLGLLELQHLVYPRLLTGFVMLVFFTNLTLMEFQVRYFLFLLLSVIDSFGWFLMGRVQKNGGVPQGSILVLHFFFPRTARSWNSLSIKWFPLTYDLNDFKSRINKHLLLVVSF